MSDPQVPNDPNMNWDGTRWLRWDGQQWVDAQTGVPVGAGTPAAAATPAEPAVAYAPAATGPMPPQPLPQPLPQPQPKNPSNTAKVLLIVGGGAVVFLVLVIVIVVLLRGGTPNTNPTATSSPSASDNGVAALPASEILAKAQAAALAESSVHLSIEGTTSAKPLKLNVSIVKTSGAVGTFAIGTDTFQFYATESNIWVKADNSYWVTNANPAAAAAIGTKWLKMPATNEGFAFLANFANYAKAVDLAPEPPGSTVTKGESADLNGQQTIILINSTNSDKLWIATTGKPLPQQTQKLATATSADSMLGSYSQWGSATLTSVPAESDSVDISTLPAA